LQQKSTPNIACRQILGSVVHHTGSGIGEGAHARMNLIPFDKVSGIAVKCPSDSRMWDKIIYYLATMQQITHVEWCCARLGIEYFMGSVRVASLWTEPYQHPGRRYRIEQRKPLSRQNRTCEALASNLRARRVLQSAGKIDPRERGESSSIDGFLAADMYSWREGFICEDMT